jgi:CrcB protein
MTNAAWIGFLVAAAIGAVARYTVDGLVQERTDGAFPWGTFVVNITGCLVLGVITGLGLYHGLHSTTRTIVGTGGIGAYTTFSTFSFETVRLAQEGAVDDAVRNAVATFVVGLAAAAVGLALAAAV